MKKIVVAAILGTMAVTSAFAQGHINLNPYGIDPYNQVFWDPSTPGVGNQAVTQPQIQLQFFYALGTVVDPLLLTTSATGVFTVNGTAYNPGLGHGGGGYFDIQDLVFPTWSSGVVTVMLRATGNVPGIGAADGRSILWQIPGSGVNGIVSTANPANQANFYPGIVVPVPEPSMFALAGLGAATLLIFRRRK